MNMKFFFFLMIRRPPRSTRTDTLFPYTTLFRSVQNRLLSARAGVRAEDEQMSERLSVVEPPVIPDQPNWPNRPLIAAIGVLGGLVVGMLLALAVELFLLPIRDTAALKGPLGAPPLGIIPVIEGHYEIGRASGRERVGRYV